MSWGDTFANGTGRGSVTAESRGGVTPTSPGTLKDPGDLHVSVRA